MTTEGRRRVAVTGACGFIGSHTVEALVAAGCRVLAVDDLTHPCGHPLPPEVDVLTADAGGPEAAHALRQFRPHRVLHLASKGGVERARRDPACHVQTSVASSVALFQSAAAAGASRLVSASTGGAIYGRVPTPPVSEFRQPAPLSVYGAGKLAEEGYLATFGRLHRLSTMALRYGNVYGPRQDGTGEAGVIAITCTRLARYEDPIIYGDGEQSRDFVYVHDVVRANLAALASDCEGVVNVGTGRATTIRRVVFELTRISGRGKTVVHAPARSSEVRNSVLDASRARAWLGWSAAIPIDEGLPRTLASFAGGSSSTPGLVPAPPPQPSSLPTEG